jgi:hypothetical protein
MLDVRCPEYLEEVKKFAASVGLSDQLQSQLDYLDDYGNIGVLTDDPKIENRCILSKDFAPHSFAFAIERPTKDPANPWKFWFNGGLIAQFPDMPADGSAPSFCVSLAPGSGWFVHT